MASTLGRARWTSLVAREPKPAGAERGFTLIEIMLSVAIMSMLVALSVPVYQSFTRRNDLDIAAQSLAGMLVRAQTYARNMNGDNAWSVEIQSSTLTLFKGTNFAGRDTTVDETNTIYQTPSGLSEVQFAKFTGIPNTTGSITLTSGNDTRTITINAKGSVDY